MGKNTSYDDDVYARTISDNQADPSRDIFQNAAALDVDTAVVVLGAASAVGVVAAASADVPHAAA